MSSETNIVNSALWSAYGDAIGFITELADEKGVEARCGKKEIHQLCSWTRLIGGLNGAKIELPLGTYSDDTQLRLATSRCINANGFFDVESFAKIELPVWLSYCLGAGRGTKSAASNLTKTDINWFSNYYSEKNANYFQSGGNGSVMRIQPHVWAGLDSSLEGIFLDVFRNTICTHGHTRAIVGACFHAHFLYSTLRNHRVPSLSSWSKMIKGLERLPDLVSDDMQISAFWIPSWENFSGISFSKSVEVTVGEMLKDLALIEELDRTVSTPSEKYINALDKLGCFEPSQRGSGTKTAMLASYLSLLFHHEPATAMILAANQLGSDTDTIATTAGAILGAISNAPPPEKILDHNYIERESLRISHVNSGVAKDEFSYPDLFSWKPPRRLVDSLSTDGSTIFIKGLGRARTIVNGTFSGKNSNLKWVWAQTAFGQKFLIRTREELKPELSDSVRAGYITSDSQASTEPFNANAMSKVKAGDSPPPVQNQLIDAEVHRPSQAEETIYALTNKTINRGFDPLDIGNDMLSLLDSGRPVEDIVAYTAILTHARRSSKKH